MKLGIPFVRRKRKNSGADKPIRPDVPTAADKHDFHTGTYHYLRQDGEEKTRIHLRIDAGGDGLLLVNAARVYHLNPTAAFMAWLHLEDLPAATIHSRIRRRYKVSRAQAQADFQTIQTQVQELIRPDGACPIHDLDLEVLTPFSKIPSAPYRMDLAVTYRCNNDCPHCYNARPRTYPEISTQAWKTIIEKLWAIGIPHITFTGGEATLRPDLSELIAHAQKQGQITGLLTNGRRLADRSYVRELAEAGLDHVQITFETHHAEIHDQMVNAKGAWQQTVAGIRNTLDQGLYLMTNTTLLETNTPSILDSIDYLAELGVPTVGFNSLIYSGQGKDVGTGLHEDVLPGLLQEVRDRTDKHGMRLVWYTPTQYCHFDPVQMDLGVKSCTAALYNMCVEPDGSVIPCQSYYHSLGNIQHDDWDSIWNHDLSRYLRERKYAPEKCTTCDFLQICGGGCPLALSVTQPIDLIDEITPSAA